MLFHECEAAPTAVGLRGPDVAAYIIFTRSQPLSETIQHSSDDGAEQEHNGFLLVHHAIRNLMHQAARQAGHDPGRISFIRSLRVVRRQVTDQAAFSPRQTHPRGQSHPR